MDISIIICSYNRAHNLPECFDHLARLEMADSLDWEVILVDNNSSDDTRVRIETLQQQYPFPLHYCFESKQGLSHARNHGIREARGRYLVFIDDDIRVTPKWLCTLFDTFETFGCDAVGGRIHVESPQSLPRWITPEMYGFLGHQDFGDTPGPMDGRTQFPFGGNMAMKREVFEKIGDFDTELGRKGEGNSKEELFKGEETDFFHRLADAGGTFHYHPDILVHHKILPYQLKKSFFLTLHNNAGILKATLDQHQHQRTLFGVPLFIFPQLLRATGRYLLQYLRYGTDGSMRKRMNISYFLGMMQGYRAKNNNRQPIT